LALALLGMLLAVALAACQSRQAAPEPTPVPALAAVEEPAVAEEPAAEEATAVPAQEEAAAAVEPAEPQPAAQEAAAGLQTFRIVPEGTEARFYINEVLLGQPKTVIGVTSDVTGELRVDPQNPGSAEIAAITINARDLTTDSDRRNGAIRRFILQSERNEYQYIVFEPVAVEGLPASVAVGDTFQFRVSGNLTVRDVTNPVTFELTVTPASESEISGIGAATVNYPDFGLAIPEVPSVTGVEDEVRLEIEFRAVAG
jgi:polyisoprenoid-binding protein YceI